MEIAIKDIQELLRAFDASQVTELALESGEFKLSLKKHAGPAAVAAPAAPMAAAPVAPAPAAPEPAAPPRRGLTINAPMVGTFYRAPSPDAPPFADVGEVVKPGQTVCIIEAMKLMNELETEVGGRVARFLVENGEPVEYGQPLIELEPA
ncbi:MAG: acetyl-CoA carboxylase biotin carboxyl carrier protein [Candidatus Sericytochromatia bacterium]